MDKKSNPSKQLKTASKKKKAGKKELKSLKFTSPETSKKKLEESGYLADEELAAVVFLASKLGQPLLLEGEAGVGKTYLAQALAKVFSTELIRMQCYEGLDAQSSLYEWNYQKQMIAIQLRRQEKEESVKESWLRDLLARPEPNKPEKKKEEPEKELFSREYLLERPLLRSIQQEKAPVLLIDEIDRADEEFEAYLLELLSDFQVSVPELGTIKAKSLPFCVLTSNGVRELSDALRRRCMYHRLGYPNPELEQNIIRKMHPGIDQSLVEKIVRFVSSMRNEDNFEKKPGVAETLKWAQALLSIGVKTIEELQSNDLVTASTACLVKTAADKELLSEHQQGYLEHYYGY